MGGNRQGVAGQPGGVARVAKILIVLAVALSGCGGVADLATGDPPRDSSAEAIVGDAAGEAGTKDAAGKVVCSAFMSVATQLAPTPVYGWTAAPEGVRLSEAWWPVIEMETPDDYDGEHVANPYVVGVGTEQPQAQIVLEMGDGWAVVVENFRGDLGDVAGKFVGKVCEHAANLYSVAGGRLVQWNDGGRWYGVFGRGLSDEDLVRIALEAQVISPE